MIRYFWGLLVSLSCIACPAYPGAWLRDPGTGFLATSVTTRAPADLSFIATETSVYLERGTKHQLTYGADINLTTQQDGHAIVFLRRPVGAQDRSTRFAYELGIGARNRAQSPDAVLRFGLSAGRGLNTKIGRGWLGLDSSLELEYPSGGTLTKLDATLGLSVSARFKTMLQIQSSYRSEDESNIDLIPSLLWEIKPQTILQMAIQARHSQTNTLGLRIGLWREF